MRAGLLALCLASLCACDFGGAFERYCDETGQCVDAGNERDAGAGDAGDDADAGASDAGTPDAGRPDAGGVDAGRPDAGVDAGPVDAGDLDAGPGIDAGLLAGANISDGGVLPGCAMSTFFVSMSSFDGLVGECALQTVMAQKPDGSGSDLNCGLLVDVISVPEGLSLFNGASCGPAPTVSSIRSARAERFGTFQWFVSVTSQGHTVSSPVRAFTAKARLSMATPPLEVGACTQVTVTAVDVNNQPAAAAQVTNAQLTVTGATRCGGLAQFAPGDTQFSVGLQPSTPGQVTVNVSGALFEPLTMQVLRACVPLQGACASATECCQGSCVNQRCE